MFNVPNIMFNSIRHLLNSLCFTTTAIYLSPTSNAWFCQMAHHIITDQPAVYLRVMFHMGAGADYRHIAQQHIDKLWKFIYRRSSEKITKLGFSRVVNRCLKSVCIIIDFHGAKLIYPKILSIIAGSQLSKIDRALAPCHLIPYPYKQEDKRIQSAKEEKADNYVEQSFHNLRHWIVERFIPELEDRHGTKVTD